MAKKDSVASTKTSPADSAMSLFDRENLEFLDALRYEIARVPHAAIPALSGSDLTSTEADASDADHVFALYKIDDNDESWGMGELNVKIIHRGRIRISRTQWQQVIATCSDGFIEDGIRKDFHLNILLHPSSVRLIYISYRYKQPGDKQRESRRGALLDGATNLRELMMHLAYWFTAQPHAEKNYPVWKKLVEEAMSRLPSQV
jgi:hypothetical protein